VLEFFLSREEDIDAFLRSRARTRALPGRSNEKPTQDRIVQTALEILAAHPAGMEFASLIERLHGLLPNESENTIRIYEKDRSFISTRLR
jgi:hypothetical protein